MAVKYLADVVTLQLDAAKCAGCGQCAAVCPRAVFSVEDGKARILDRDSCIECGACALNCPTEALCVDAGVGCATAVIRGALRGTGPDCGCDAGCCEG